jgi:putative acetyltransferase
MVIESLVVRVATPDDVATVAVLARRTRMLALPFLPVLHTADEDVAFFYEVVFPRNTVLIAEIGATAVGFIAYGGGWVDHLYVDPLHHGRGIGRLLLERAQRAEDELQLWCFQENPRALRFYARNGFRVVRETDGDNEEGRPDVLLSWSRQPFLRANGDAVTA